MPQYILITCFDCSARLPARARAIPRPPPTTHINTHTQTHTQTHTHTHTHTIHNTQHTHIHTHTHTDTDTHLRAFRLSLGVLSAIPFVAIAGVRLLPNPCFSIGFISILALTGGAVCDPVHRDCWSALASKSMLFHWFY